LGAEDEPLFDARGAPCEGAICRKFGDRILAYGLCHLRDRQDALDLVQHVLLSVLQSLREGRLADRDKLDAYVLGTCRNATMDVRRGEARQRKVAEATRHALPEAYEPSFASVDLQRLELCLGKLEPRARAVVFESFIEEHTAQEIGATMKLSSGNVRVIRHRALAALEACMEGQRS
jgi:RNA polymerase sigma factor (sigma-70 family)